MKSHPLSEWVKMRRQKFRYCSNFIIFVENKFVNLINRSLLERLKRKNRGNIALIKAIDKLINDVQENDWNSQIELKETRPDADCVHSEGFYFFNLNIHRTMILIEFDESHRARVVWTGSHQEYEKIFKNNRSTIKKWLKDNGWI